MGGNVFPGSRQLSRSDVSSIIEREKDEIFAPLCIREFCQVGGFTHDMKLTTNDIDVAVKADATKLELIERIKQLVPPDDVRLTGQLIHIRRPMPNASDGFYQLDLMMSKNPSDTSWLMNGFFRHMVFAYLAKRLCDDEWRVTIIAPGGIKVMRSGITLIERTEDPHTILDVLGVGTRFSNPRLMCSLDDVIRAMIDSSDFGIGRAVEYLEYVRDFRDRPDYRHVLNVIKTRLPHLELAGFDT